jgi:hypothetical protein
MLLNAFRCHQFHPCYGVWLSMCNLSYFKLSNLSIWPLSFTKWIFIHANNCIYVENSSHVQNYSQWIQSHTLCIIYICYQFHPHGHVFHTVKFDWYELVSLLYSISLIDNWMSLSSMSISLIICMGNQTSALCSCALPIMITWWKNKLILWKLSFIWMEILNDIACNSNS